VEERHRDTVISEGDSAGEGTAGNDVGDGRGCAEAWDALREAVNDRAYERRHGHHHRPLKKDDDDEREHGEDLALVGGGSGGCGSADGITVVCVCVCWSVGGGSGKVARAEGQVRTVFVDQPRFRQAGKQPGSHFTVHVSREQYHFTATYCSFTDFEYRPHCLHRNNKPTIRLLFTYTTTLSRIVGISMATEAILDNMYDGDSIRATDTTRRSQL
jgi:hypothetical protein